MFVSYLETRPTADVRTICVRATYGICERQRRFYRGVLALDHALEVGPSARYEGQPNAGAYMELLLRAPPAGAADAGASGRRETHIFKANHPDDAANWLADFDVRSCRRRRCRPGSDVESAM